MGPPAMRQRLRAVQHHEDGPGGVQAAVSQSGQQDHDDSGVLHRPLHQPSECSRFRGRCPAQRRPGARRSTPRRSSALPARPRAGPWRAGRSAPSWPSRQRGATPKTLLVERTVPLAPRRPVPGPSPEASVAVTPGDRHSPPARGDPAALRAVRVGRSPGLCLHLGSHTAVTSTSSTYYMICYLGRARRARRPCACKRRSSSS